MQNLFANLENLILPANTALNKNFETDANAYKENGTASVGTSENISRSDHVHPTDQTRLSKNGDSQDNTVTLQVMMPEHQMHGKM